MENESGHSIPIDDDLPSPDATVLVVDDDEALADTYALWLEDVVDVHVAYTSDAALDVFAETTVDAVLLDRRMPRTSGDELLETLRERGQDCPAAMVSAVEPRTDLVELPFDDYLLKPVGRDALLDTVSHLLGLATSPPAVREYLSLERKLTMLEARAADDHLDDPAALAALRDRVARQRERALAALGTDDRDDNTPTEPC